jgi:hypothetical protein
MYRYHALSSVCANCTFSPYTFRPRTHGGQTVAHVRSDYASQLASVVSAAVAAASPSHLHKAEAAQLAIEANPAGAAREAARFLLRTQLRKIVANHADLPALPLSGLKLNVQAVAPWVVPTLLQPGLVSTISLAWRAPYDAYAYYKSILRWAAHVLRSLSCALGVFPLTYIVHTPHAARTRAHAHHTRQSSQLFPKALRVTGPGDGSDGSGGGGGAVLDMVAAHLVRQTRGQLLTVDIADFAAFASTPHAPTLFTSPYTPYSSGGVGGADGGARGGPYHPEQSQHHGGMLEFSDIMGYIQNGNTWALIFII